MTVRRLKQGKHGEDLALGFLRVEGYHIIDTNYRCFLGEVDIIAKDKDVLCFIEVRSKSVDEFGCPFESITPLKQHKLIQLASHYIDDHNLDDVEVRFDVIGIKMGDSCQLEIIKNAFELS